MRKRTISVSDADIDVEVSGAQAKVKISQRGMVMAVEMTKPQLATLGETLKILAGES